MRLMPALLVAMAAAGVGQFAFADTADVKTQTIVEVKKKGAHCEQDPNCFNRYHPAIKPVARAKPGDLIVVHTRDALDSNLNINSTPKDVTAIDVNLIHPMTGPIYIEGAKRGDVLAVKLIDINPNEYGYTTIIPGFGFLPDLYTEPFVANWKLNRYEAVSEQVPGVRIPMNGFMGSVGVMPGQPEVDLWLARETSWAKPAASHCHLSQPMRVLLKSADRTAATRTRACVPFHRVKTAATWTSSKWSKAPHCCCHALLTVAASSSATCTTHRVTAKWQALQLKWVLL